MSTKYRADLPVWILMGGLSSLPWLGVWANAFMGHGIQASGVLFGVVVSAFAFAWLFSFRIVVTPTEVVFRSLFRGRQRIRHDQIKIVRLAWQLRSSSGPMRLIIEPREGSGARQLEINAKVFSGTAVKAVLNLGARVAEADDGGLLDGVVMKKLRGLKGNHKR